MAGVLPLDIEMTGRLVDFGYATVKLIDNCLLGRAGTTIRGHSFHYSRIANKPDVRTNYHVEYSISSRTQEEGYRFSNVLASYIHLHFRAEPSIARSFIDTAVASRTMNLVTR
jgi:cobyrinic acid a,c-diamide synthase